MSVGTCSLGIALRIVAWVPELGKYNLEHYWGPPSKDRIANVVFRVLPTPALSVE